jgi:hypothetical protein
VKHERRAFEADSLPGRVRSGSRTWLAAWLAVALWGLGCVPGVPVGREVSQAIGQWRRPRVDAGGRGPAVATTSETGVASMAGDAAGGVSAATLEPLRALTLEAMTVNPSILAAVADVRA